MGVRKVPAGRAGLWLPSTHRKVRPLTFDSVHCVDAGLQMKSCGDETAKQRREMRGWRCLTQVSTCRHFARRLQQKESDAGAEAGNQLRVC